LQFVGERSDFLDGRGQFLGALRLLLGGSGSFGRCLIRLHGGGSDLLHAFLDLSSGGSNFGSGGQNFLRGFFDDRDVRFNRQQVARTYLGFFDFAQRA
jgi:hypothetical protein